ncbi:MAG: hypothetical protein CMQ43_03030 [Gammaproteobacteria bacterium]|jgi:hypothetical protein|nr:hypothetical protein [Gammaproteobacteria bacterium]|tara:strand:+ start:4095 stop:4619 length:525 start_codon:yes stop_codon:yes gene_type:complete
MNKSLIFSWAIPGVAAIAVAGLLLARQWSAPTADFVEAAAEAESGSGAATTTADLVDISAVRVDARTLRVTLQIAGDWHVNANPASLDFLIPTVLSVSAAAPVPLTVDYPAGREIDSALGDAPWRIYDDGSVITANLGEPDSRSRLTAEVHVQACHDSGRCLPPDTIRTRVIAP